MARCEIREDRPGWSSVYLDGEKLFNHSSPVASQGIVEQINAALDAPRPTSDTAEARAALTELLAGYCKTDAEPFGGSASMAELAAITVMRAGWINPRMPGNGDEQTT